MLRMGLALLSAVFGFSSFWLWHEDHFVLASICILPTLVCLYLYDAVVGGTKANALEEANKVLERHDYRRWK